MRFGAVPLDAAEGEILAHSVRLAGGRLAKGRRLTRDDLAALAASGHQSVTVARLDADDIGEDVAATRLGAALTAPDDGLTVGAAFTGRVNLHAARDGLFELDAAAVAALNAVDPAITLATLAPKTWVRARQLVATVKIIPYAAPARALGAAQSSAVQVRPKVWPRRVTRTQLILTATPGLKATLLEKGAKAVAARLQALGCAAPHTRTVHHTAEALAAALASHQADLTLILTGSATSDAQDVGPEGLRRAGGTLTRYGMPVDPGNLLFLGQIGDHPVLGLPGCARSPALNGADWVLERLVAGRAVTSQDIAAMGVGGLLKEIPSRPQPRGGRAAPPGARPRLAALVLAAGRSRRMKGVDKLLEPVGGQPLLAHVLDQVAAAPLEGCYVALPASGAGAETRRTLAEQHASRPQIVPVPDADEGMAASLRRGIAALPSEIDGVVLLLADMPEIAAEDMARLAAAFDPEEGREIVRATSQEGRPGHPVLFGRRYFETLQRLSGDRGAKAVVAEAEAFGSIVDVALEGERALVDLDTPEAWAAWRAKPG